MDNPNIQKIKDLVTQSRSIAILVGGASGLDEMASALSLFLSLRYANKQVVIACPVAPTVAISSLVGIDKVKTSFQSASSGGDLVVSFPYREGEIEKVSYTIDNGFLNIVVKAGETGLAFDERDVQYKRGGEAAGDAPPELMFVIGTPRLTDLGNLFNPEYLRDTRVVNIDNKVENQGFGDIILVSPQASSVSELIADVIMGLGLELDLDIAQNLLSGISDATSNFQSPSTSSVAFEIAGVLMRKGAVREKVSPIQNNLRQPGQFAQPTVGAMPMPQMPMTSPMPRQARQQPISQPDLIRQRIMQQMREQPQAGVSGIQQAPVRMPQQSSTAQQGFAPSQPSPMQNDPSMQADEDGEAPSDWLTPKVYKGSTSV